MKILDVNDVVRMTGLSRPTLKRAELAGKFPARIKLSKGRIGYVEDEILAWIESLRRKSEATSFDNTHESLREGQAQEHPSDEVAEADITHAVDEINDAMSLMKIAEKTLMTVEKRCPVVEGYPLKDVIISLGAARLSLVLVEDKYRRLSDMGCKNLGAE